MKHHSFHIIFTSFSLFCVCFLSQLCQYQRCVFSIRIDSQLLSICICINFGDHHVVLIVFFTGPLYSLVSINSTGGKGVAVPTAAISISADGVQNTNEIVLLPLVDEYEAADQAKMVEKAKEKQLLKLSQMSLTSRNASVASSNQSVGKTMYPINHPKSQQSPSASISQVPTNSESAVSASTPAKGSVLKGAISNVKSTSKLSTPQSGTANRPASTTQSASTLPLTSLKSSSTSSSSRSNKLANTALPSQGGRDSSSPTPANSFSRSIVPLSARITLQPPKQYSGQSGASHNQGQMPTAANQSAMLAAQRQRLAEAIKARNTTSTTPLSGATATKGAASVSLSAGSQKFVADRSRVFSHVQAAHATAKFLTSSNSKTLNGLKRRLLEKAAASLNQ
jgi:hypothetical protein